MLQFAVFTVFAISLCFRGGAKADCREEEIRSCIGSVMRTPSYNAPELEQFCQQVTTSLSCLKKLQCMKNDANYELWQSSVGIVEGNNYLCTREAREVYLEHGKTCAARGMSYGQNQRCISKARAIVEQSLAETYCRQNTTLLKCEYDELKNCSEDFARLVAKYYYTYLKRVLAEYNCDFDTSYLALSDVRDGQGNGVYPMTSSVTSLAMLIVASLVLSSG